MNETTAGSGRVATGWDAVRAYSNPATIKGGIALMVGLAVLLLPELSLVLVEIVVGVGLLASGLYDLWYLVVGHGFRTRSRLLALFRAPLSLLAALIVLATPRDALTLFVALIGLYLIMRGVIDIAVGILGSDRSKRGLRIAGGLASVGFGVLATTAPATLAEGLIVGAALVAVIGGAMVFSYGMRAARSGPLAEQGADATLGEVAVDWVQGADIGRGRRAELSDGLYFDQPGRAAKLMAWWVMLLLSVTIATLAVLQDSIAVVVGAMLIAPLMVPILGLSGALVNGWRRRAWHSALLLIAGVFAAILTSYALSAWAPVVLSVDTNSQITSRVNPNMVDMLIALAAGAAGAFATVDRRVASSIAGVAIAVALVPPLSVVGITLGAGDYSDAGGAMLLFLTNFVAIVLAAGTVFVLRGFANPQRLRERRHEILVTMAPFAALAAVILVPLVFTSEGLVATATQQRLAQGVVSQWLDEDSEYTVEAVTVREQQVDVRLSGPQGAPPIEELQYELVEQLQTPLAVSLTVIPETREDLPTLDLAPSTR